MRVALYQPDQAGNVGTILRTAACFGVPVDIILPCGFAFSERSLKRSGMDYLNHVQLIRHESWDHFRSATKARMVLFTTRGSEPLHRTEFRPDDVLLFGSESRGAPEEVHQSAALRVRIGQRAETRSLNLAVAAGIGLAEALRQTGDWPQ